MALLLKGMLVSLWLTIGAAIFGFLFANLLAVTRIYKIAVFSNISTAFVEFTRNTPLIVQLFFISFGLPLLLGYQWPFWCHALLALSLNFSAYFAEILRAGFEDVGKGQVPCDCSAHASCKNIRLQNDPKLKFRCMFIIRSSSKLIPGSSGVGQREQVNQQSAFIDGSVVYGFTKKHKD